MRAFGPGSVSSFLKMALDVVRAALWLGAAIIGPLGLLILIYLPFAPAQLPLDIGGKAFELPLRNPAVAAVLMGMEAYLGCLLVIVGGIRRVVETLTVGDPFRPENVQRLRVIGLALVALEASSYLVRLIVAWTEPAAEAHLDGGWFNPTAWFAVLVVFVLAEVFREGARLRREAELTI
jgi:Protein of unknown function (DUF2975)